MQFFKAGLRACFFMVVIFWVTVVQAQPLAYGLAAPGYSGLGLTPSAAPIDWGAMSLSYGTANPGANMLGSGIASGHNINLAIGVLPGVEIDGRLATNNLQCNLYGLGSVCPPGSYRDLSANFKLGHTLEVGQNTWVSAAAGTTDYGGAATNFRSFYAAVSVRQPWWALTLGSGKAVSAAAPLAGFFGMRPYRCLTLFRSITSELDLASGWVRAMSIPCGAMNVSRASSRPSVLCRPMGSHPNNGCRSA